MIGSSITSIITTNSTLVQVLLGMVPHHKPIIGHPHEYRVTSTYHEFCRFIILSPTSNIESSSLTDFDANHELIHFYSDNFDAHIPKMG